MLLHLQRYFQAKAIGDKSVSIFPDMISLAIILDPSSPFIKKKILIIGY